MAMDQGKLPRKPRTPGLWGLLDVRQVEVRRRRFDPPRRVTDQGVDREVRSAVEIEIRVSEPFAIRALGPVLWVGDEPLTVAESDGKELYRFFSFKPQALKPNASISLAWNSSSAPR